MDDDLGQARAVLMRRFVVLSEELRLARSEGRDLDAALIATRLDEIAVLRVELGYPAETSPS
jgi:hypothetical protein